MLTFTLGRRIFNTARSRYMANREVECPLLGQMFPSYHHSAKSMKNRGGSYTAAVYTRIWMMPVTALLRQNSAAIAA